MATQAAADHSNLLSRPSPTNLYLLRCFSLYHPREVAESTRSQKPPTKPISAAPEASTSATNSSGHAYISSSNYKISIDTSISQPYTSPLGHQEFSRKFRRKKV
ncbi:hypothetical protein TorRG33x02_264260 [Trema orientale]|uniref:Uncharacterized protein n=1 Tax=Trema orientale TaxID=63057 RepID=A0A2P5D2V6_TREOI|nr:hypothetical protein TorRG33x02_264260 [Trema orientale]